MNFREHLERKRTKPTTSSAPTPAGSKVPEEMTEAERDREIKRLEWEKEKLKIKAIHAGRQELGEPPRQRRRPSVFPAGPKRLPYK